jgi:hypothetical protein
MNKKYFAKYIQVKVEINEIRTGDKVTSNEPYLKGLIGTYLGGNDFLNHNNEIVNLPDWQNRFKFKKVKLVLCSRDIQAGDILKECNKDNKERIVHHFEPVLLFGVYVYEPWPSENEEWIQADQAFKVIGEISPEAIWVKEGDEFDEDEVHVVGENSWGERQSIDLYKETDNPKIYCEIKGPCGYFH